MIARSRATLPVVCREVLDPLARVFLKLGFGAGEFATFCKIAYVRAVAEEQKETTGYVNRSRVAVVTGLTRPEVSRLLKSGDNTLASRAWHRHRAARVLDGWHSDPRFASRTGPLPLPVKGAQASFEALVRKYGGDIPAKAVLRELMDAEAISKTRTGLVRPRRRHIALRSHQSTKLAVISMKLGTYLQTLLHNLEHPDDLLYEQTVSRRNVSAAIVPYLRHEIAARGNALLSMISDQLRRPRRDINASQAPNVKFGVSFFVHAAPERRKRRGQ